MQLRGPIVGFMALALVACSSDTDDLNVGDDDDDDNDSAPVDDDDDLDDDDDSATPTEITLTVQENPYNPHSAVVEVVVDRDVSVLVEYGEGEAFDLSTPEETLQSGVPFEILVLGLRADREYRMRVVARDGQDTWSSEATSFETQPLAAGWPACTVQFGVDESEFDPSEALCTRGTLDGGDHVYYCVDRWGEPVLRFQHPDNSTLPMMRVMSNGEWAALSDTDSELMLFDARGELISQWPLLFFQDLTRFQYSWISMHDVIELTEGPWAGHLAVVARCQDTVQGQFYDGGGVIVFDWVNEQVVWDWCAHGEVGDEQPIDPLLSYDRPLLDDVPGVWLHLNALLHGLDEDGGQFFWFSSRAQDWIFKVDVETDAVVWRLGYGGDFTLVEDLDDPESPELPAHEWFYHQHAPELVERGGSRTRFLVFDNGNVRADPGGGVLDADTYSRVAEFHIDEQSMCASLTWEYGARDPEDPGHLYAEGDGDADLNPDGTGVVFIASDPPTIMGEAAYPGAGERWRLTCEVGAGEPSMYRANYFPTLYDRTWWYDHPR